MVGCWHQLLTKLTVWLMVELLLNVVGLDTLADYSEYLLFLNEQNGGRVTLTQSSQFSTGYLYQLTIAT